MGFYKPPVKTFSFSPFRREEPGVKLLNVNYRVGDEWESHVVGYTASAHVIPRILAWASKERVVAIDLETTGLNAFDHIPVTFQIGLKEPVDGITAWVVDLRGMGDGMRPLFDWLEEAHVCKLGQNIGFEYRFLRQHYGLRLRNVADTQLMECVLRAGLFRNRSKKGSANARAIAYVESSMDKLAQRYLGHGLEKEDHLLRTGFGKSPVFGHSEREIAYAAGDVVYPFRIAEYQRALAKERQLTEIIKLEFEFLPVRCEMEHRGMLIDREQWMALYKEAVINRQKAEDRLNELGASFSRQEDLFGFTRPVYPKTGKLINYSASEQIRWFIVQYCQSIDWPIQMITTMAHLEEVKRGYGQWYLEKGREIPDHVVPEDTYCILLNSESKTLRLAMLRKQLPREVVEALLDYAKYDIRIDTFGAEFLKSHVRKDTGRVHTEVHQAITATGRVSTTPNCYDAKTEILTPNGWVRFEHLQEGTPVAQYDVATATVSFVVPSYFVGQPYDGPMLHYTGGWVDHMVTPNHRMLYVDGMGAPHIVQAIDYWGRENRRPVFSGYYRGGGYGFNRRQLWLLMYFFRWWNQPSFCLNGDLNEFQLRARSQQALRRLYGYAKAAGWAPTKLRSTRTEKNRRHYILAWSLDSDLGRILRDLNWPDHSWKWLLRLDERAQTEAWKLLKSKYMKQHKTHASMKYRSQALEDTFAAFAAMNGMMVLPGPRAGRLRVYNKSEASRMDRHFRGELHYSGKIYCVTVPTGMVVVRRNGFVRVSGNTQNYPRDKRYRQCFIPGPGRKFVIADYSQQEPRLTAQESKDPVYITTYRNKDDIYIAVGESMLGHRPNKKTPEGKLEREIMKIIVLSMAYRSGVAKLRDQLTLGLSKFILEGKMPPPTMEYARQLRDQFFEKHESILSWQNESSASCDPKNPKADRMWDSYIGDYVTYVRAPCGRLRMFGPDAMNTYTEGPNHKIQGGSASMTKYAGVLFQRRMDKLGWQDKAQIVNLVHDEVVVEADDDVAQASAQILKECMEEAGAVYCKEVPIIAEFPENTNGVVPYWTKAMELTDDHHDGVSLVEAA